MSAFQNSVSGFGLGAGSPAAEPQVLLYHFPMDDRTRMLRRFLRKSGIAVRMVEAPEFLHPLGYLFGIPGFTPCPQFNMGGNFQEEMMVIGNLSGAQTDALLDFFHSNKLAPVQLKAVLTPITSHWSSLKLYEELSREHRAMKK